MVITATEAKINFGKYIKLAATEDIYISKNGTLICKFTAPDVDRKKLLDELTGIIPWDDVDEDAMKEERLARQ